ncbi:MAG: hypothetical protein NVSMB38_46250 [Ktedonobacteraceae bacterium]
MVRVRKETDHKLIAVHDHRVTGPLVLQWVIAVHVHKVIVSLVLSRYLQVRHLRMRQS